MARKKRYTKEKPREVSLKTTTFGEDDEDQMSDSTIGSSESENDKPSSSAKRIKSDMEGGSKKQKLKERNSAEIDEEYEVERIVDDRLLRGKRQYKVSWKGYPSSQDTWENREDLDCDDLLNEYLDRKEEQQKMSSNEGEFSSDEEQSAKIAGNSKSKIVKKSANTKKKKISVETKQKIEIKPDENGEFVVSRIIDMHVAKNGKHEYLVNWKGFPLSQSSWEPEENVKDTAAFEKFLKRLEEAKSADYKELRVLRRPTDRFTISSPNNRRLSRRFQNKQRPHYFDAE